MSLVTGAILSLYEVLVCLSVWDERVTAFVFAVVISVLFWCFTGEDESLAEWTKEVENVASSSEDVHLQNVTSTRLQVTLDKMFRCLLLCGHFCKQSLPIHYVSCIRV